jgi:uncharacterized protein YndB with AHSA1/START domain
MNQPSLSFTLERTVEICADQELVFRYFTDPARFAEWWGPGSHIDARPGGTVEIRYPNQAIARGEVVSVEPPHRIVFTYGYDDPAKPIAVGGSRVTVTLTRCALGTRVELVHAVADSATRDDHVPGWRYHLARFASVVAQERHGGVTAQVDAWLTLFGEPSVERRAADLERVTTDEVTFRDPYACVAGRDDLLAHIAASQLHMPGVTLVRDGEVAQCQGTALARWQAKAPGGQLMARGANVYQLAPDGRIAGVVGLWG